LCWQLFQLVQWKLRLVPQNTYCYIEIKPCFQTENLAVEIYNIDWYNARSLKIHKFVLFWLAQAQIPVQISGAGILMLNRALVLRVSFYYLKSLRYEYKLRYFLGAAYWVFSFHFIIGFKIKRFVKFAPHIP
jgi:hypothetical protein